MIMAIATTVMAANMFVHAANRKRKYQQAIANGIAKLETSTTISSSAP